MLYVPVLRWSTRRLPFLLQVKFHHSVWPALRSPVTMRLERLSVSLNVVLGCAVFVYTLPESVYSEQRDISIGYMDFQTNRFDDGCFRMRQDFESDALLGDHGHAA